MHEEIRKTFNITNNFTPEEEEQIKETFLHGQEISSPFLREYHSENLSAY